MKICCEICKKEFEFKQIIPRACKECRFSYRNKKYREELKRYGLKPPLYKYIDKKSIKKIEEMRKNRLKNDRIKRNRT